MSNPLFVVSIIAKPPAPPDEGSALAKSDGNTAIEDIVAMLRARSDELHQEDAPALRSLVYRAAYVIDISLAIKDVKAKHKRVPDILQIIGHGSAGRLELGSYWSGKPWHAEQGSAVLDSNPFAYGVLSNFIPASCSVLLLGCGVGSRGPSGFVANGKTLLFDLEEMSQANVYAAADYVSPRDFRDGVLFSGRLVGSNGKPANPTAVAAAPATPTIRGNDEALSFTFREVHSAPALVPATPSSVALRDDINSFDGRYRSVPELAEQRPLAMTELELGHSRDDYGPAQFILGLRYFRAQRLADGATLYFQRTAPEKGAGWSDSKLAKLAEALATGGRAATQL